MSVGVQLTAIPATLEVKCANEDCEPDVFELYYTYDTPDDVTTTDLFRPYCGESYALEEIQL